jgi:GH25 family lysozyme M1 (1,4-beta-N-acetylmuramidase)
VADLTFGIDCSKWQGKIDWAAVGRSGLADFAAVRVTIGLATDPLWQDNLAGAADHVEVPMAYAVVGTRAAQADAADLLVNMVDRVASLDRVGLVVDAENFGDGSHPTMTQVHAFRDALHRLTGRWPMAYLPDWWLTGNGYRTDTQPWPWWPSRYVSAPWDEAHLTAAWPPLEHGFTVAGPWQFTSSGTVAGIAGSVDRNVWFGTVAELRVLALGEETDVPLSDDDLARICMALGLREGKRVADSADVSVILRGDPTHPDNLKSIHADTNALTGAGQLDAAAVAAALAGDQRFKEDLARLITTGVELAGHPGYEGEAVISMRPRPAAP